MPEPVRYRVVGRYRRTVSALPELKRLVAVKDLLESPLSFGERLGELCPDVIFYVLEDQSGRRYWAKRWLNGRARITGLTWEIERFVATLGRDDVELAVQLDTGYGLVYRFDPQLFESPGIVHKWDCRRFFNAAQCEAVSILAATPVRWPGLPEVALGELTDFQVAATPLGLVFLDFEPSKRYEALIAGARTP